MASPAEEFRARIIPPPEGRWNDIIDHMQFLHDTVLGYRNPRVVELGVRGGNSTCALLSAVQLNGGHLWSCDLEPPGKGGDWDHPPEWDGIPAWTFIIGDSVSDAVLAQMPAEIDVLFADTSHTYEQTLAELEAYVPRVRPGGVVLQHDTQCISGPPGGREFLPTPRVEGEVARAMDDYCEKHGLSWANRQSGEGLFGLGVIRIPSADKGRTPRTRPKR